MTSVRLPEDLNFRLNALAAETHRTKSFYIVEAIRRHIEDMEDLYVATKRDADQDSEFYTYDEILKKLRSHHDV